MNSHDGFVCNPICHVIMGFKSYKTHATRSKYISFSINEQPAMCQILLDLSVQSLSSERINNWPERLFQELVNYGLFLPAGRIKDRIKNFFNNILNENRRSLICYKGTNWLYPK